MRPWSDRTFTDLFQSANGWSVRDFWARATFGHLAVEFDIGPWGILRNGSRETLKDDRAGIVATCREQAEEDLVPVAGYPHLVAFVHEPPANTGLTGRDLVLDQTVRGYRRAIGRLIGFGPAFGPTGEPDDQYCVLGSGDGRIAGATLVRYVPGFRASVATARVTAPMTVALVALSEAAWHQPTVAIVPIDGGEITVEYRVDTGDDHNVLPALVIHSIGKRSPGDVQLETTVQPRRGAAGTVFGVRVLVLHVSPSIVVVHLRPPDAD